MSENLQSLSERRGPGGDLSEDSRIPKIQLFGAKSFYEIPEDRISKKNFFGKCDLEKDGTKIPFYSHVADSIYSFKTKDIYQFIAENKSNIQLQLNDSGLTGRGGAGFPFAKKLEICTAQQNKTKYVVCNAEEGDTGAFSDKYLLEEKPDLVLAGMYAAGITMGAELGVLYISDEYLGAIETVREEIRKFASHDSGFKFQVVKGGNSYITGEESALLNSLEGQRAEARVRPPYPGQEGLFKKPTLVSNVETFATVPWIIKNTGMAHAALGTSGSSGAKLVSLGNYFKTPGVHEIEFGETLEKIVYEYGGGFTEHVKGLFIGGPLGGVVPMSAVTQLNLSIESFEERGFLLGHASIVAICQSVSIIELVRDLFDLMANESCGKCFPCRLGTRAGQKIVADAINGRKIDKNSFDQLLETLQLGSLCGLGGGLPVPVRNILEHFKSEVGEYFAGGLL